MKIKALTTACLLTVAALASCGGGDVDGAVKNIKGGSKDEKQAIQDCVAYYGVALLSGESTVTLNLTDTFDANPDDGQNLILATKVVGVEVNMTMYDVAIEWDVSKSTENVYNVTTINDNQILVDFAYSSSKNLAFSCGIKKISCGGAVSEDPQVKYNLNLKKIGYRHDVMPISELNAISDDTIPQKAEGEYGYKLVNYEKKDDKGNPSPYWDTNNPSGEKKYYYVDINGEVLYTAPDGNWGLIADGDQVMELYAGKALNLLNSKYPDLAKKHVQVSANMSQYQGNIQVGFITFIRESSAANKKTASWNYQTIDTAFLDKIKTSYTSGDTKEGQLQCVPGMNLSNALVSVTGTFVPGSLSSGTKITKSARNTFRLKVAEGYEVTVAYDYHTDKDGSVGLCDKLNQAITQGNPITIKGTYRYNCSDKAPFIQGYSNVGHWEVVPFLNTDCSF